MFIENLYIIAGSADSGWNYPRVWWFKFKAQIKNPWVGLIPEESPNSAEH